MGDQPYRFLANDAFVYVDTYRRLLMGAPPLIRSALEQLEEKTWSSNQAPSRLYAELRAHQHALERLLKEEEPGLVVLGEAGSDSETGQDGPQQVRQAEAPAANDTREELMRCRGENEALEASLKQAKEREHELQGELVQRRHEIGRLERRLSYTHSTATVLGTTLAVVTIVLVFVLFR